MNSLSGFIKLHRKLIAWGWYQDYVVKCLFLHLLLTANFKETQWRDRTLKEGQVVVGTKKLSQELGFSVQQVRTAINKLKSTNEITVESTNRYSVITIVNWQEYQSDDRPFNNQINTQVNNQATNKQQTINKQITNNQQQRKNDKNGKKEKNDKNGKKREGALSPHGTFTNVLLTDYELADLKNRYPQHYEAKIDRLSRYIENKPDRNYPNHYAVLLDWLAEDVGEQEPTRTDNGSSYDIKELNKINTLDFIE